ncbi:MAG: DUF4129 domain-containing protein [Cyclobacteriaceae bacterium]
MRLVVLVLSYCLSLAPLCGQEADTIYFGDATETADLSTFTPEYDGATEYSNKLMPADELETTRDYQSEPLSMRKFDAQKWKEIVGDADFNEDPSKKPEPKNKAEAEQSSMPWAGPLLKLFSYAIIIGVVLLLLYMVLKNVAFDLRIKRGELRTDNIENGVDNIEDVDIQALLEQARAERNFRVAVRLYYLGLLKKLHELNVIVWKKDKTNRDYLSELFARDFYFEDVRVLTHSYEAVWYGQHSLAPETFRKLSTQFESIYQKMNNAGSE